PTTGQCYGKILVSPQKTQRTPYRPANEKRSRLVQTVCSRTRPGQRNDLNREVEAAFMNNRRRGALIGLAVGDALGAAVEFKSPGSFLPVTGYRSGGGRRLGGGGGAEETNKAPARGRRNPTAGRGVNTQARRNIEWGKQ